MRANTRRAIARRLCCLLLLAGVWSSGARPPREAAAAQEARPEEVVLTVTVTDDYGRHVTGLGRDFFTVFEGKAAREVTSFRELGREPLSLALVFDVSRSMRMTPEAWAGVKAAAARLVSEGDGSNEYLVAEFGGEGGLRVLAGWTRDREAVSAGLNRIAAADSKSGRPRPRGLTYWKDACADALEAFGRASHARRALLLVGDAGEDSGSRTGGDELKRRMRQTRVLFYAAILLTQFDDPPPGGAQVIEEIAWATGGRHYVVKTTVELASLMERLAQEFRNQYGVGFAPTNAAAAGEWSEVRVRVAKPQGWKGGLRVRTAGGYFSRGAAAASDKP